MNQQIQRHPEVRAFVAKERFHLYAFALYIVGQREESSNGK